VTCSRARASTQISVVLALLCIPRFVVAQEVDGSSGFNFGSQMDDIRAFITERKQRSTIRQRKAADVRSEGTRECSSFMPEKLGFEKACRHRRTVHLDQIPASAKAELVNRSCDDFLPSPGFASDQNSGVRRHYRFHFGEDWAQTAVAANDCLEERRSCTFWLPKD
jgi:hypothetical protein